MYYKRKKLKIKKLKIFTHTFLNIDESRNLTILKYITPTHHSQLQNPENNNFFELTAIHNLLKL
jgi:hypothetical protein